MHPRPPGKPGLQAERTQLSWERNAFAFLAVGAIPLLGHGPLTAERTVLVVVGTLLALLAVWLGHRRAGRMTVTPRVEVLLLGWATAGFATLLVVFNAL
jgi:putative membrane protein